MDPLDPITRTYQQPDLSYRGSFEAEIMSGDSAAWRSIAVEVLSSGLLLVKAPRSMTYEEDTRPVQLLDIAPTILAHFGRSIISYPGTLISRVESGRQSEFYAHSRDFDGTLSKYRLTRDGWRFV